jgi:hypothetical protein
MEIKIRDPGSEMENPDSGSGIRDENHGSAALVKSKARKNILRTLTIYSCPSFLPFHRFNKSIHWSPSETCLPILLGTLSYRKKEAK